MTMRLLLVFIGCCMTSFCMAQSVQRALQIRINYEKDGKYLEQAIETIVATNHVKPSTVVNYEAGKSVSLLPGFLAYSGSTFTAAIKLVESSGEFILQLKAYPNPFDESTVIDFTIPESGNVNLVIVDEKGQLVERLLEESPQTAGRHQLVWKPQTLASGVYIPVLRTGHQEVSKRLIKK